MKTIKAAIVKILKEKDQIHSIKQIQNAVGDAGEAVPSVYFVKQVLREEFGMRYKRIKRVPFNGNSDRNLILR